MAENKDARGFDIFINGIKRSYRDELTIAEEAVRYFRRNASNADVTLFDRKKKVFSSRRRSLSASPPDKQILEKK